MSINGNYNVLLGAGAQLPSAAGSHQIVLGSGADTVYLGGAGASSAGGVIINSAGVTLSGVATFTVSGQTGALGQALTSAGAGAAPYWGPPLPRALASDGTPLALAAPLASLYSVTGVTPWALSLPSPAQATGTGTWLKNMANQDGTVGSGVVTLGATEPTTVVTMAPGDSGYFESDGVTWWVLSANQAFTGSNVPPIIAAVALPGGGAAEGPTAGGTSISVAGAYFAGAPAVALVPDGGGTILAAAPFTVVSDSAITVVTPSEGGAARAKYFVRVTTPGGTTTSTGAVAFYYDPPPILASLTVTAGPLAGGAPITLTGTNFISGVTTVAFGSVGTVAAGSVTYIDDTSIRVTPPNASAGAAVSVTVTTPGGTSGDVTYTYYVGAPTLASLSVTAGPLTGGAPITLTGTNFISGVTTVAFGSVGTVAAGSVTYINDTSIRVTPPNASAGGGVSVTVTTPGGTSSGVTYTYYGAPTLTTLSPANGPVAGGIQTTLIGTNFINGGTQVVFGDRIITFNEVTYNSFTSITVTSPAASAGVAWVVVSTQYGTSSIVNYTYT